MSCLKHGFLTCPLSKTSTFAGLIGNPMLNRTAPISSVFVKKALKSKFACLRKMPKLGPRRLWSTKNASEPRLAPFISSLEGLSNHCSSAVKAPPSPSIYLVIYAHARALLLLFGFRRKTGLCGLKFALNWLCRDICEQLADNTCENGAFRGGQRLVVSQEAASVTFVTPHLLSIHHRNIIQYSDGTTSLCEWFLPLVSN